MSSTVKQDFWVSYSPEDGRFAEWIAWTLEAAGYSTVIRAWDFRAGHNFVLEMQRAASEAERTIAVLSPRYLQTGLTQAEWASAFVADPTGRDRKLIPVRIETCEVTGLLRSIVYVDLVGVPEANWEELLLRAVAEERPKPAQPPIVPQLGIPDNLPRVNALFVGRDEALRDLHELLRSTTQLAIGSIQGMGGIGKTELALHYALQHLKAEDYPGGVCWLRAREDVGLQVLQFAREKLNLLPPDDRELLAQVEWCWKHWQNSTTLIVLDDVQSYDAISRFLPPQQSQFKVLLTTRRNLGASVQNYEIQVLSEAASLQLLRSLVPDGRIDQDLATAKQVCDWLGYLPLGLELVGRYLARKKGTAIAKLWERLQGQRLAAKALLEAESGMTASLGVTAAFELSWQELNPESQRLAALLSLFALAEIPWSMVQDCLPDADEETLEDLRDEQLVNSSLLSFEGGENYLLHQLLREFFAVKRSVMPEDEAMKRSFYGVMLAISQQLPDTVTLDVITRVTGAIPHLKEAAVTMEETAIAPTPWFSDMVLLCLLSKIAQFYKEQSVFEEAEEWSQRCLESATQRFGVDHPAVAASLNRLAELYRSQGRYGDAEPLYLQALELLQQLLGNDHPDVAHILNNLAALYWSQGRYAEAEPIYLQALEIQQRLLGNEHPAVASILNNLAGLYWSQGRYEKAESLYLQALEIIQRQLGNDHPAVVQSFNNLAELYRLQGRYEEAEPLHLKTLEIRQRLLGNTHPDVAQSLNNLAELYQLQGRYGEAEPLYLQALEIMKRLLGNNHPNIAASLNNLATLYQSQGHYGEAELLLLQALDINQQQLGSDHPDIARNLNNLAELYKSQGRYEEAEPLYLQALQIMQRQLGNDHSNVAISLSNLAALYQLQGRYGKAEPLYLQALEIMQQQLGNDHPFTAQSLNNLAELYNLQERYGQAEPLYLQALEIRQRRLGNDHPDVAQSLNSLAGLYWSQERYSEMEPLLLQALEIRQRQLGNDHPDVATSLNNLAELYNSQGYYGKAESLFLQAISIFYQRLGETHPNTQTVLSNFVDFLQQVIQSDHTTELSQHPTTRSLLQQLQNPES